MDRINGADFTDIGDGKRGFQNQNAVAGVAGTEVTAEFLNNVQEEIATVIEKVGLTLDAKDWTQLWQALNRLNLPGYRGRHSWHAVKAIDVTTPPISADMGDAYLVPNNATGDWAKQKGNIAIKDETSWIYITSQNGHGIGLPDGRVFIKTDGAYIEKIALDTQSGKWNYAEAGGTANVLTITLEPIPTAYPKTVFVKFTKMNTASATLKVNSLAPVTITRLGGGLLQNGDLPAGGIGILLFDGKGYQVASTPTAAGGLKTYANAGTYTFTVPAGITTIKRIRMWAGGGGGGGSWGGNSAASGGGGSGYGELSNINVTPNQVIAITVGSGGAAGRNSQPPTNGSNGGASSFGAYLTVQGAGFGSQGHNGIQIFEAGKEGAAPSGADVALKGLGGGVPWLSGTSGMSGGAGGSSAMGGSSTPPNIGGEGAATNGIDGISPGGGGSGGVWGGYGGKGADGMVVVEY